MIGSRSLGRWLARQDPRKLCRRLRLDGWQHIVSAEDAGDELLFEVEADGPWPVAVWALAFYRGGVEVEVAAGEATQLDGLEAIGVRRVDRLSSTGRRAIVGSADEARLRLSASGDRRRGFQLVVAPCRAETR